MCGPRCRQVARMWVTRCPPATYQPHSYRTDGPGLYGRHKDSVRGPLAAMKRLLASCSRFFLTSSAQHRFFTASSTHEGLSLSRHAVIIDGTYLMYRNFFAMPFLSVCNRPQVRVAALTLSLLICSHRSGRERRKANRCMQCWRSPRLACLERCALLYFDVTSPLTSGIKGSPAAGPALAQR